MINRVCTKCKKKYPATAKFFYRQKTGKFGLRADCKKCCFKYRKQSRQTEKSKEAYYGYRLKSRHGSNALDFWNDFFVQQNGICPGCGRHQSQLKRKLCLDHDHKTGKFRGLLCNRCNFAAGDGKEHIQILKNLVKYLEDFYE